MAIHLGMTMADLSSDALAELEAKLVADLEMVRKVRALLDEHRGVRGAAPPLFAANPAPQIPFEPDPSLPPRKSFEETLSECLIGMGHRPFAPTDFRQAVRKARGNSPDDKALKAFLNRMIRQGQLVVHEFRKGRPGCLYKSLIPLPKSDEVEITSPSDQPGAEVFEPISPADLDGSGE